LSVPDDPKAEKALLTKVASAPQATGSTLATGADVSRFQRSTVPGKAKGMTGGIGSGSAGPDGGAVGTVDGPVVRVARGNSVTEVPVGGKK
jgi:pilus assembly protein CpaB